MASVFSVESTATALSSAATKSLFLLDAGTNEYELIEFGVGFDTETDVAAVRVELYRVTTIGSPAGTSTTPKKHKEASGAADTTSLTNLSTEPSAAEILGIWYVRPDGGQLVVQYPLGDEPTQRTATDGRLGLRAITATNVTPNAVSYARIRE